MRWTRGTASRSEYIVGETDLEKELAEIAAGVACARRGGPTRDELTSLKASISMRKAAD